MPVGRQSRGLGFFILRSVKTYRHVVETTRRVGIQSGHAVVALPCDTIDCLAACVESSEVNFFFIDARHSVFCLLLLKKSHAVRDDDQLYQTFSCQMQRSNSTTA